MGPNISDFLCSPNSQTHLWRIICDVFSNDRYHEVPRPDIESIQYWFFSFETWTCTEKKLLNKPVLFLIDWHLEKLKKTNKKKKKKKKKKPQARINSEFIGIHAVTEWCKHEPDRTRTVGPYGPEHRYGSFTRRIFNFLFERNCNFLLVLNVIFHETIILY